jgi:Mn2+/Fe2+ NRAMP family transporter
VLIPNLPLIKITLYVEAFNAFVLPLVLAFLLLLVNDPNILGARRNGIVANVIAVSISLVCVVLGAWMAFLTFTGQAGS